MSEDEWVEFVAEFLFTTFSYPAGQKTARRRFSRAWKNIPEPIRKKLHARQSEKFEAVMASIPQSGTLEELAEL